MTKFPVHYLHDSFDSHTYLDKSNRNIQRVSNKLDDYINEPNKKNIHDIRKAIRRLEATYRSLPKTLRKKRAIREYTEYSKKLFSINSQIRDFDIISGKLSGVENPSQQDVVQSINRRLFKERRTKLKEALSLAIQLRKLHVPRITKFKISNTTSKKRFKKVIAQFVTRIEHNLPIVINNSHKVTELHELRKDCKKLRYLMELLPDNSVKEPRIEMDDNLPQLKEKLEKVQDILGIIHDYDTIIAYLKHSKSTKGRLILISSLLSDINIERQNKYGDFVRLMNGYLSLANANFFVRARTQMHEN